MKKVIGLAVIGLLVSTSTFAAGDAAAGKAKSAICASCHGANGIAVIPGYPNLKGQNAQYIESSLKAYKSKQRNGGNAAIMQPMAAMLNDTDISNLAAYYSTMK
ncbi:MULTISPECIES: c-type cytochrome [Aliivibrio]|jgi:cytochrome c553|uniref:Cytochrome C biogenesis protein CcsB n=3 Tax=Aliivibrio TaxID=511678 RepID=A0A1B9NXT9_ALILO|nr:MULTISPECIES: cytochrome c [Aliivibrio]AZL85525.1 cytochrome c [Aliivibrio salmonicida]MBB1313874.1 cytochrome c [Aliivibrio sp. SR45-2]OCH20538.1 cytochrome C biogenesis protein CcsB [Aliivibrio logei]OEF19984.1 cytochrome C biogenesis protein CcsB [Aliivibrio logei 5S-186]CAQ80093.1 cytochrome c-552 [Aliivibrio salmonicida LFI1238]